jgi:hypothetical protein
MPPHGSHSSTRAGRFVAHPARVLASSTWSNGMDIEHALWIIKNLPAILTPPLPF